MVGDEVVDVGCDGGGDALGHPLIYLLFDGHSFVDCYYCGERFAKSNYQSSGARAAAQ